MTPEEAIAIASRIYDTHIDAGGMPEAIASALLSASRQWQPINHGMPEGQQTVVFFDADRREACFGTLEPRWRFGVVRTLLRAFGFIRPVPTHWIGLPVLPPKPSVENHP